MMINGNRQTDHCDPERYWCTSTFEAFDGLYQFSQTGWSVFRVKEDEQQMQKKRIFVQNWRNSAYRSFGDVSLSLTSAAVAGCRQCRCFLWWTRRPSLTSSERGARDRISLTLFNKMFKLHSNFLVGNLIPVNSNLCRMQFLWSI